MQAEQVGGGTGLPQHPVASACQQRHQTVAFRVGDLVRAVAGVRVDDAGRQQVDVGEGGEAGRCDRGGRVAALQCRAAQQVQHRAQHDGLQPPAPGGAAAHRQGQGGGPLRRPAGGAGRVEAGVDQQGVHVVRAGAAPPQEASETVLLVRFGALCPQQGQQQRGLQHAAAAPVVHMTGRVHGDGQVLSESGHAPFVVGGKESASRGVAVGLPLPGERAVPHPADRRGPVAPCGPVELVHALGEHGAGVGRGPGRAAPVVAREYADEVLAALVRLPPRGPQVVGPGDDVGGRVPQPVEFHRRGPGPLHHGQHRQHGDGTAAQCHVVVQSEPFTARAQP